MNISLQEALKSVDLTETQRKRAEELYRNLCDGLTDLGLSIDYYPQGSFATKTVIRPIVNDRDAAYDVDVICQFNSYTKDQLDSGFLMNLLAEKVGVYASNHKLRTKTFERCVTVIYADDYTGCSFSIDLIPSVEEDVEKKQQLLVNTELPSLVYTSIAIDTNKKNSTWITNNPKGYQAWFEAQVGRFRQEILTKRAYATIEPLPDDSPENMILTVIKYLKRHQEIFYLRGRYGAPSPSIVITTIVGKLADGLAVYDNEADLFMAVVEQLKQIEAFGRNGMVDIHEYNSYPVSKIVQSVHREWTMMNPANGEDNILSSWNEDTKKAANFFKWIDSLNDLLLNLQNREISLDNRLALAKSELELSGNIQSRSAVHTTTVNAIRPWGD